MAFTDPNKKFTKLDKDDDVKIKCSDDIVLYFNSVLLKRVLYFKEMLESGMKESKKVDGFFNIEITDFPSKIVEHFLKAIYENTQICCDETNIFEIYEFANKYDFKTGPIVSKIKNIVSDHVKIMLLPNDNKQMAIAISDILLDKTILLLSKLEKFPDGFELDIEKLQIILMAVITAHTCDDKCIRVITYFQKAKFSDIILAVHKKIQTFMDNNKNTTAPLFDFWPNTVEIKGCITFCWYFLHLYTSNFDIYTITSHMDAYWYIEKIKQAQQKYKFKITKEMLFDMISGITTDIPNLHQVLSGFEF